MKSEDSFDCVENENFNIKMPTALYNIFIYSAINYCWIHKACINVIYNNAVL